MARVLVVDDDPPLRRTMTRILESEGFDVVSAPSGEWGLDEIVRRGCDFAAVIVDWSLPGMTGHRFAERAIKLCPELRSRILHVSGYRPELPAGASRLDKPFGPAELLAAVRLLAGVELPVPNSAEEDPDDDMPTSPETPEAKQ